MKPSRRRFLRSIAAVPALTTMTVGARAAGRVGAAGAQVAPTGAGPQAPAAPAAAARALGEYVKERYGQHLAEQDFDEILRQLDSAVKDGDRLASAKLANADEPDCIFRAAIDD